MYNLADPVVIFRVVVDIPGGTNAFRGTQCRKFSFLRSTSS